MMNKNGRLAPMTVFIIGLLAMIATMSMASLLVTEYYTANPRFTTTNTTDYDTAISSIISHQEEIENAGFFSISISLIVNLFTTTLIGLGSILNIVSLISIVGLMLNSLEVIPLEIAALIAFFTSAAAVYITMKVVQALRATPEPP